MCLTVVCEDIFHLVSIDIFTWCVRIVLIMVCEDALTMVCKDVRIIALASSVSRVDATHRVVGLNQFACESVKSCR